jgi:hypothetical protein
MRLDVSMNRKVFRRQRLCGNPSVLLDPWIRVLDATGKLERVIAFNEKIGSCGLEKEQAIGYAETRARLRTGEIRIFDSTGNVERVITFDDANRGL